MHRFYIMDNPIQEYAWGSKTAISSLLGHPPTDTPQAEMWMGAHPKAPSIIDFGEASASLFDVIRYHSLEILGEKVTKNFNSKLPYLFKVLAAAEPLSIQAHPSLSQAKIGFERENEADIPLDAYNRSYKDENHKPECLCALTHFWAMAGFRKKRDTIDYLRMLCPKTLADEIDMLGGFTGGSGLRVFFHSLITKKAEAVKNILNEALPNAERLKENDAVFSWIAKLYEFYPEDIGVISPSFLNLICLEPGQAIYLPAGQLHAYLDGVGMELMANSDNVLRGGLTPKYIDVSELLNVLDFSEFELKPLDSKEIQPAEMVFETPAKEFQLSVISVHETVDYASKDRMSAEILFCENGQAKVTDHNTQEVKEISNGASLLIPASVEKYTISGIARIYKASVPMQ